MSTGYSWEGIRQVRATLLGARHVPERLCGGYVYLGRYISVRPLPFLKVIHYDTNRFLIRLPSYRLSVVLCSRTHRFVTIHNVTGRERQMTDGHNIVA